MYQESGTLLICYSLYPRVIFIYFKYILIYQQKVNSHLGRFDLVDQVYDLQYPPTSQFIFL